MTEGGNAAPDDAFAASETAFRSVADVAAIPLWRSGLAGDCIYVNRAWRDFTGHALEAALDQGWHAAVHPEDLDAMRGAAAAAHGRREPVDLEYRLRRQDGAWRWLHDRRRPLWWDGQFAGVLGCCLDGTDLRQKAAEWQAVTAERDRLISELEHRVRNNAQMATSLLSLQAGRATDKRVAEALRSAALRIGLGTLIQERMMLAVPATGVALGETAEIIARAALAAPPRPEIRLEVRRSIELRLPVARAQPLVTAFGELVTNAALHAYPGPTGGTIGIALERLAPERVQLRVDDVGIGLPRRRPARTPTGKLGLHLAERLAGQAGAELLVQAGPTGVGLSASLRFPG